MAANLILSLLAGLSGAGKGFVEEERAEREQTRREAETRAQAEHQAFERAATAEKLFQTGLDTVRQLPLNMRPQAFDAVAAGVKKLGATIAPGLRDRFITDDKFGDLYQRSLTERRILPELVAMMGPADQKLFEDIKETVEELKLADARRGVAGGVPKGQPGSELVQGALERGVDPGKVGAANVPFFPPSQAAERLTGPELRAAIVTEMNWRVAAKRAQDEGRAVPPAPVHPAGVELDQLPDERLVELARGTLSPEELGLLMRGLPTLRQGHPAPLTPAPAPELRRGAPAGAGTGGGALPQRGDAREKLSRKSDTYKRARAKGLTDEQLRSKYGLELVD